MIQTTRSRAKLAVASIGATLVVAGLPHAASGSLLDDIKILSANETDCSAAGNAGDIDGSGFDGSANGLQIIDAGNGTTNNNCSVLSGNSLFPNGLLGAPLVEGPVKVLSGNGNGGDGGGDGGTGGNGALVGPIQSITAVPVNFCASLSILFDDGGCNNALFITNILNGLGGF